MRKIEVGFLVAKSIGVFFVAIGLLFGYFAYYPYTERVESFRGIIVDEYDKWQNLIPSLVTPSFLVRYTPFFEGPYHIVFRSQDYDIKDLNYFDSNPSGKLYILDKSQTYSIEYNPSTNRIYNMWIISKINGEKIDVGPQSYGSNFSKMSCLIAYGFLGALLTITGILLLTEKKPKTRVDKKIQNI